MLARVTFIITALTTIIGLLGGFRWLFNEWKLWRNRRAVTRFVVVLGLVLASAGPVFAQNHYSLEIMRPRAIGTAGSGLDADNRIYRAYQGITYKIHADARGGHWPYTYSLSNAPAGMSIVAGPCTTISTSCTAGEITWTNPQSTASDIVVTIRDVDGVEVTGTWTVTVSTTIGADGFCFIDATNGNDTTGSGSLASPWASIGKAQASCGARSILYFRAGTYVTTGTTTTDGTTTGYQKKAAFTETSAPVIWLAHPDDARPVINFAATGANEVELFDMTGQNIWIEGLEAENIQCIGWRFIVRSDNFGAVVRNVYGHDLVDGVDGNNCGFFLWAAHYAGPTASFHDTVQYSTFTNTGTGSCALKVYSVREGVWETSSYATSLDPEAILALKAEVPDFTVRANQCASDVLTCIGGNMDNSPSAGLGSTRGETYHNLCLGSGTTSSEGCLTLGVSLSGTDNIGEMFVYRNTFIGKVNISNTETADGPLNFSDNVILNSQAAVGSCPANYTCHSVTDYTRIVDNADNVKGANDGSIANATTGALVGDSRTNYLGISGYELVGGQSSSSPMGMFLLESAGTLVAVSHALFMVGALWQRRSAAVNAAIKFWLYATELPTPKDLFWAFRYKRAVKRWQQQAPIMLPAPTQALPLNKQQERQWH